MQYPFTILDEWKPTNEPAYYKTKAGDDYCLITLSKCFKGQGDTLIRDTIKIQCFGSEFNSVKHIIQKYGRIKGIPLEVHADRIPYYFSNELCYNYRATKIAMSSSFYLDSRKDEKPTESSSPQLIRELDDM